MNVNEIKGFHVELTNMCTLKCPGCARTRFIEQWPKHWRNHSLDVIDLINFLDIDLSTTKINLCGVYGDPIYHPDFLQVVQKLKHKGAKLSITTNGSYKTDSWWKHLTSMLAEEDKIVFSVDGLPENFTEYRVNGDWHSIKQGMDVVANARCKSAWKYIVFSFNEENIAQAEEICKNIGLGRFIIDYSDRFDEQTVKFIPTSEIHVGPQYNSQELFKQGKTSCVDPKCKNNREHYISADGYYSPCCFVADHRFYYKTEFGKNKKHYSIKNNTISALLSNSDVENFYSNLQSKSVCQYNCPKI